MQRYLRSNADLNDDLAIEGEGAGWHLTRDAGRQRRALLVGQQLDARRDVEKATRFPRRSLCDTKRNGPRSAEVAESTASTRSASGMLSCMAVNRGLVVGGLVVVGLLGLRELPLKPATARRVTEEAVSDGRMLDAELAANGCASDDGGVAEPNAQLPMPRQTC